MFLEDNFVWLIENIPPSEFNVLLLIFTSMLVRRMDASMSHDHCIQLGVVWTGI